MKFIELTDRFGEKITINFDRIEKFMEATERKKKFTRLDFMNGTPNYFMYVTETYEQVKEALGV